MESSWWEGGQDLQGKTLIRIYSLKKKHFQLVKREKEIKMFVVNVKPIFKYR